MSTLDLTAPRAPSVRSARIRTFLVMIVAAIVIGGVVYLVDARTGFSSVNLTADTSAPRPAIGEKIPDFSAVTVDGKPFTLSSLTGKGVWLTFGASWCGDCRAEAPDLEATAAKYRSQGLAVVGVFVDEDATAVGDYAKRVGLDFTLVPDPRTIVASRFRIMGLPTHYFITPDGVIRQIRLGGLRLEEMDRLAASVLR